MAFVVSGCFLAPRGFKGESFVEIYQKGKFLPKEDEPAFIKIEEDYCPFIVERFFSYPKGDVLKLSGISTRDEAKKLKGKEFFLERSEETDFLGKEIIGFEVYDLNRSKIGEIVDFEILSPYILLICKNEKGIYQIPLVRNLGYKLLREERRVIFNLPEDFPGVDYEN
ncbi:MAG: hypothetical protein N2445_03120 [Acidobacteria bacterium]|nr:hypothetical protein [Acidobacteriota bacterium]